MTGWTLAARARTVGRLAARAIDSGDMIPARVPHGIAALVQILLAASPFEAAFAQTPRWLDSLGYVPSQVSSIRVGPGRLPYVPVRIDGTELWLLFDTGNTVGLTVATRYYDRLGLPVTGTVRRRNSSGRLVGEFRIGRARRVEALGHTATGTAVREFQDARLVGLYGPDDLPGVRFTLDYRAQVIAVAESAAGPAVVGEGGLPLVRSRRHPRLVLVEGRFRREPILIELDTGKSRTVVDPAWARSVGLEVGRAGSVALGRVVVGSAVFDILDAKPVGLAGIDPALPAPLVLSLGSDTLSRFVMTVDYARGFVLLWEN